MKAIGYIRVSTEQQAGEGVSLEAQRAKIEAWCLANDCELAEVFVDAGISGKSMKKRQGLQKALASAGKGMALVVYSLSRLARSTKDTLAISERTTLALAHKKATGQVYGTVPFGYQEIEGRLEAVETEAKLVAEIQSRRQAGETLQSIADTLNSQGIAGKQGGKWYPSTVRYLIQRQAA